jgi:hypothetical protein
MTQYYVTVLALVGLFVAVFAGWIVNIMKLIFIIDGGITAMLIVRLAGVFFVPLGAVMGYL